MLENVQDWNQRGTYCPDTISQWELEQMQVEAAIDLEDHSAHSQPIFDRRCQTRHLRTAVQVVWQTQGYSLPVSTSYQVQLPLSILSINKEAINPSPLVGSCLSFTRSTLLVSQVSKTLGMVLETALLIA